ncbi:MAG: hypothetical protein ACK55I_23550, partial [bacterium]
VLQPHLGLEGAGVLEAVDAGITHRHLHGARRAHEARLGGLPPPPFAGHGAHEDHAREAEGVALGLERHHPERLFVIIQQRRRRAPRAGADLVHLALGEEAQQPLPPVAPRIHLPSHEGLGVEAQVRVALLRRAPRVVGHLTRLGEHHETSHAGNPPHGTHQRDDGFAARNVVHRRQGAVQRGNAPVDDARKAVEVSLATHGQIEPMLLHAGRRSVGIHLGDHRQAVGEVRPDA